MLEIYHRFEATVDHALRIEGQRFHVHHLGEPRVFHDLGVNAIAMRARFEHYPRENDRLARLELDRARERRRHLYLEIVTDAFAKLKGTVLPPNLASPLRHAPVCRQVLLRNRQDISINVFHMKFSLFCDADVFWLGEEAEGFFAAFAADAALLHPAERDAQIAHEPAVHPDRPGVNLLGDAMGAIQVLRPDARSQAVFIVVGVADDFFFAVERSDRDDRTEDFLAVGPA